MEYGYSAIESFVEFCDDMMIAQEGFEGIKSRLVSIFANLVLTIEKKIKQMKDSKLKTALMKLLSRAKKGLAKSKSLNERNPKLAKELQEEAKDIQNDFKKYNLKEDEFKEFKRSSQKQNDALYDGLDRMGKMQQDMNEIHRKTDENIKRMKEAAADIDFI